MLSIESTLKQIVYNIDKTKFLLFLLKDRWRIT